MKTNWMVRLWYSLSTEGVLLETLFFAFSLSPALLPRNLPTKRQAEAAP
jgi:uncharacterized membrane protein